MTKMIKRISPCLLACFLAIPSCGTGVGNPTATSQYAPGGADFYDITYEYQNYDVQKLANGKTCGSFIITSSEPEIEAGRTCIREAFAQCHPAKYLIDKKYPDGSRFASFVSVFLSSDNSCKVYVHTASTHTDLFDGIYQNICTSLDPAQEIEFACRSN